MTLLTVVVTDDAVLLGADSASTVGEAFDFPDAQSAAIPTGNVATFEIEDSSLNQPFAFGGGAPIAVAAWEVLKRFKGDCEITTPEQLGEFMDAVCLSSQGYAHPVNLWRVDADGSHPVVRQ
jgi:hypothetical protein